MPDTTILTEFVSIVKEMREAQKAYFKVRTKGALIHAKELERKVDKFLIQLNP